MQPVIRIPGNPVQVLIFICLIGLVFANNTAQGQTDTGSGGVLFILDGSGSMWGRIQGTEKIVIAREVMGELINELPDEIQVGLLSYGHRSRGQCDDIEMLVPVGGSSKKDVIRKINGIMPKGKTPITQSFQLAGEQLRDREDETTVVLISDGEETCGGDPCALVRDLRQQAINVRVHVVGFDVGQAERDQLVCIAEAGDGKYFSADNADQLKSALTEVKQEVVAAVDVKKEPPKPPAKRVIRVKPPKPGKVTFRNLRTGHIEILDTGTGESVAKCNTGACRRGKIPVQLSPGHYKMIFRGDGVGVKFEIGEIEVGNGQNVVIDANELLGSITVRNAPDYVDFYNATTGKKVASCMTQACRKGDQSTGMLPGTYKLRLRDKAYAGYEVDGIEVKAGEEVVIDLGGGDD